MNARPLTILPVVAAAVLAAAGCATSGGEPARPGAKNPETVTQSINLSGYPPDFQRGFREGCSVARAGGSRSARPKGDSQHAVGWNDGFDYCAARK